VERDTSPVTTRPPRGERSERRTLAEEVLVVLSLSLLHSAVLAVLTLFEAPVSPGVVVAVFPSADLARQLTAIVFGLAPVALVAHLIRRGGEGLSPFGLDTVALRRDAMLGLGLAAVVSAVGLALYLGALALEFNRFVVPVPPLGHWWTVPVLVLGSAQNALLEEVIVVGYLIRRLEQLGWAAAGALVASAVLRGSYHLYQGWGGFTGNLLLGLFFGLVFLRWRRTWPLVVAHFAIDVLAGAAYIGFRGHCLFGLENLCIR
jgi:membrane protease YdiL (CAAX protease family)